MSTEFKFTMFGKEWVAYLVVSEDNTKEWIKLTTSTKPWPTRKEYAEARIFVQQAFNKPDSSHQVSENPMACASPNRGENPKLSASQ